MDPTRDLKQWEYEHTKRVHVYKIPASTVPYAHDLESFDALQSDTGSRDATAKFLARKYYEISFAHNDRQFDRDLEPWRSAMPSFQFEVAFGREQVVGLDDYLELGRRLFGGDPSLRVEIQDVSVHIDLIAGVAEVFANHSLVSTQITRKSVCVTEFRRIVGKWLIAGGKNIKGDEGF